MGDSLFSFRMRNSEFSNRIYIKQKAQPDSTGTSAHISAKFEELDSGLPIDTDGYTYGYVFFRQERDDEVRRGFFQKSLVLLSPHPWPGMFLRVVQLLGPELMKSYVSDRRGEGESTAAMAMLEAACFNIAAWYLMLTKARITLSVKLWR
jgi:hypothetical protein